MSLFARPEHALIIGIAGGFVCSTSHHFLRRSLEKKLGVTDTVGAISLHAFPGYTSRSFVTKQTALSCSVKRNRIGYVGVRDHRRHAAEHQVQWSVVRSRCCFIAAKYHAIRCRDGLDIPAQRRHWRHSTVPGVTTSFWSHVTWKDHCKPLQVYLAPVTIAIGL